MSEVLAAGTKVRLWVGLSGMMGFKYPDEGVIKQYIEDYPGGPAYEVGFPEGSDPPFVCVKPEWVFAAKEAERE